MVIHSTDDLSAVTFQGKDPGEMFQFYFASIGCAFGPFFRMILLPFTCDHYLYSPFRLTVADAGLRHSMLFALMFFFHHSFSGNF